MIMFTVKATKQSIQTSSKPLKVPPIFYQNGFCPHIHSTQKYPKSHHTHKHTLFAKLHDRVVTEKAERDRKEKESALKTAVPNKKSSSEIAFVVL
jgi:hypothetical protein